MCEKPTLNPSAPLPVATPISAIVPAHRRYDTLHRTLTVIENCAPPPNEILVHVDGGDEEIMRRIRVDHPQVQVLHSDRILGPGGSRNVLIEKANHEWVANFDDDSHPAHADYFARIQALIARFPETAMLSAASNSTEVAESEIQQIAIASGCGCVFRKSWFAQIGGFVPLPIAYGMEEMDLGLRLHRVSGVILMDPLLRVTHNKLPPETVDADTNAAVLVNTALFPFLRFSCWLWPIGLWQVARRLIYLLLRGWTAGLVAGLLRLPKTLIKFNSSRTPFAAKTVISWFVLRKRPKKVMSAMKLPHGFNPI